MNKLTLAIATLFVIPVGLTVLSMPGCANSCEEMLTEVCAIACADTTYEESCRAIATLGNQSRCAREKGVYKNSCAVIPSAGGGGSAQPGTDCADGQVLCSGTCTELTTEPTKCGSCVNDCTAEGSTATLCQLGSCVSACTEPLVNCGGSCVDTSSDPKHCGGCDAAVGEGKACSDGTPVATSCTDADNNPACCMPDDDTTADPTKTLCGSACVDVASNVSHCGACNAACATGQVCSNGACASGCAAGLSNCGGVCVDTSSDPDHCGGCDTAVGEGKACSDGVAVATSCTSDNSKCCACDGGTVLCSDTCVDVLSDEANCGACGTQCGASETCYDGTCYADCAAYKQATGSTQCPTTVLTGTLAEDVTKTLCSSACVSVANDAQHCGGCNIVCTGGKKCQKGKCVTTCSAGMTECDSSCIDLSSDPLNCGACGASCPTNVANPTATKCENAQCVDACASTNTDCSNACVDTQSDPLNCGTADTACGNICSSPTSKCSEGQCVAACASGLTDCSGTCVDLTKNNFSHCGSCNNSCNDGSVCTQDACVSDPDNQGSFKCQQFSISSKCTDKNPCTDDKCDAKLGCVANRYTVTEWNGICAGPGGDASACFACEPNTDLDLQTDACKAVSECVDNAMTCPSPPSLTPTNAGDKCSNEPDSTVTLIDTTSKCCT